MPYGAEEWPCLPDYQTLDRQRREIRLLKFHPRHNSRSDLQCSLVKHALHDDEASPKRYFALSYVWGAACELKTIYLNERPVQIRVTVWNALDALCCRLQVASKSRGINVKRRLPSPFVGVSERLRNEHGPDDASTWADPSGAPLPHFYLWVDFLCINQDDVPERNWQIQLMGHIFGSADGVFGWLGDDDSASGHAMSMLSKTRLSRELPVRLHSKRQSNYKKSLLGLGSLKYWDRIWILQEFGLSKRFWLCLGHHELVLWERFWSEFLEWNNKIEVSLRSDIRRPNIFLFPALRDRIQSCDHPLLDLLVHIKDVKYFQSTNPRDRVYGLFALTSPADRERITVDYRKPFFQVFVEACSSPKDMSDILDLLRNLAALCSRNLTDEACRLALDGSSTAEDVYVLSRFAGYIKCCHLRASLCTCSPETSLTLKLPSSLCQESEHHDCIYECHVRTTNGTDHHLYYTTLNLKAGDFVFETIDHLHAGLVVRPDTNGIMRCMGTMARHHTQLPESLDPGIPAERRKTPYILKAEAWCDKRVPNESLELVSEISAQTLIESFEAKRSTNKRDMTIRMVFALNYNAILNVLQERHWYEMATAIDSETRNEFFQCLEPMEGSSLINSEA